MIRLDEKTPIQIIEEEAIPTSKKKLAYATLATTTTIPLLSYGLFASGVGIGASIPGVALSILSAPLIIKAPFVLSSFLYSCQFKAGIKKKVSIEKAPLVKGWNIPIGVTEGGTPVFLNCFNIPHIKVSGKTGGGKTKFLETFLYSILKTHTPEEVEVVIVDMKDGASFSHFEGLPHIKGIASSHIEGVTLLEQVERERKKRLYHIKKARKNLHHPKSYPFLFVIIDEGAEVHPSSAITKEEEANKTLMLDIISKIARIGREPHVSLVYATQRPSNEVFPVSIRGQIDATIAFRQDELDSQISLGSEDVSASKLPGIRGRAIYKHPGGKEEIQTYFVPDNVLYAWLKSYKGEGEQEESPQEEETSMEGLGGTVSPLEIFTKSNIVE